MMRKKLAGALLATAMLSALLMGCSSQQAETEAAAEAQTTAQAEASADETEAEETEAETEEASGEFNPDNEDGVSIEEVREEFGATPLPADGTTVGVVAKQFQNEFWRIFKDGYEASAEKIAADQGIDFTVDVQAAQSETDETGQLAILNNMVNKQYAAVLCSPISDGNLVPGIETANEQGIPTVNVNDGLIANADYFVGPRAYQNGELAAEWISEKLGGEGQVAIVIGMPKAFAARQRTLGFEEWCAANAPGIEIVAKQNADWDRQKSKELAQNWITQYPDLKAIFCNNDGMALGVVEATEEYKEETGKDILVVGVDGIGEAYDSIRAGKLDATIDSFPYYMSQIALECGLRVMGGQELPRVVWTPQALIDSTNVDTPAEEIINWVDTSFE
ncbi:MAG: substrate-binding domain-containing protein [Candidatus Avilachnospira sp.]|jgi:ribose transport system substrate-binding protein